MELNKKSGSSGTPISEVEIDTALVFDLLAKQHPDLINLPLQLLDFGWDNVIFRLGDRLCVRLPRRQVAAKLIEHEQTWLPQIADRLTMPIPTPYRLGKPTANYPWRWSILPWVSGVTADREQPNANQAKLLGSFLRSLHLPPPANAPANPVRGVPLKQRADIIEQRIQRLESKIDPIAKTIKNIWHRALDAPIDVPAKWLHGDLHPGNILVKDGAIAGIIDWGDITSGDIATDLASIWMLFPNRDARQQAIAEYTNISEATLQRAKGWAIYFGVTLLDVGLIDNPRQAIIGERTLRCVAESETR
ncbi:MAG: aminoglycoside phosphotransferase family protein [Pleurocapsa sp. MO_226.B13]|nr:aminoglycoside phosphotransferase family protein [Pleurocapsa sp. MO_226.B13]